MRIIVSDNSSGGVLAALLSVMMLAQLFVGGLTTGARASPPSVSLGILCTAAGMVVDGEGEPDDHRPDWPCALACQAAGTNLLASGSDPVERDFTPVRFVFVAVRPHPRAALPKRVSVGLHRRAHAPPERVLRA